VGVSLMQALLIGGVASGLLQSVNIWPLDGGWRWNGFDESILAHGVNVLDVPIPTSEVPRIRHYLQTRDFAVLLDGDGIRYYSIRFANPKIFEPAICFRLNYELPLIGIIGWCILLVMLSIILAYSTGRRINPYGPGRCIKCGYCLRGVPSPNCPECRTPFDLEENRRVYEVGLD